MLPRECDNDNCDYETDDRGRGRWVHGETCLGPVDYAGLTGTDKPDGDTFLAYLLG